MPAKTPGTGRHDHQETALSSLATVLPLASDEGGSTFHAPSIADFFPPPILFEGTIFEFNRIQFVRLVAAVVLVIVFVTIARRAKLVPGRSQNLIEMGLDFVRVNVAEEILGKERAKKHVAVLTTMFFAILAFNITSIIPGLNIAGTALIGLPVLLAAWATCATCRPASASTAWAASSRRACSRPACRGTCTCC